MGRGSSHPWAIDGSFVRYLIPNGSPDLSVYYPLMILSASCSQGVNKTKDMIAA